MIATEVATLSVGTLAMGLLGGLCVFLFGMGHMTDAVKAFAGRGLRTLLAKLTTGRLRSAFAGAAVTALVQSSTVTTVLTVGFVSTSLLTLEQAIGIIMGAHVGTTVTAQIIAFKVTKYALAIIALGYGVRVFVKRETAKQLGALLIGLGLLFLGMELMMKATEPLRSHRGFMDFMAGLTNPLLAILMGTAVSALIHSSAATTGIVIILASRGIVPLETGIGIVLGANVGTCATAILASLGKGREAERAALAHLAVSLCGVLLWAGFADKLAWIVRQVTAPEPDFAAVASINAAAPREIANAHTIFNVVNLFLFIWFVRPLAWFLRKALPDRPERAPEITRPRFLNSDFLPTPELAVRSAWMEVLRLGRHARGMVERSLGAVIHGGPEDLRALDQDEKNLEVLYGEILLYLQKAGVHAATHSQSEEIARCISVLNHVQNIGRTIDTSLLPLGAERREKDLVVSEGTAAVIAPLHAEVLAACDGALEALEKNDPALAKKVVKRKDAVGEHSAKAKARLLDRLTADAPNRHLVFRMETDLVEGLKRLFYFVKRIAKAVEGEFEAGEAI